jgi:hypothetical protein
VVGICGNRSGDAGQLMCRKRAESTLDGAVIASVSL